MAEVNKDKPAFSIPEDVEARAKSLLGQALAFFAQQMGKLGRDAASFEQHQREVEERIRRGARRTDGKLV